MSLKINRNFLFVVLSLAIFTLLLTSLKLDFFLILLVILEVVLIAKKARISFFTVLSFVLSYSLLQEYSAFKGYDVYGLMNMHLVPIYFYELASLTSLFNCAIISAVYMTSAVKKEKELVTTRLSFSKNTSVIFCLFAIVISILIFPNLPSIGSVLSEEQRFYSGILPFRGWSSLPFFFLAVSLMGQKEKTSAMFKITMCFVCSWYVFHGERVDCLGFLILIFIWYYYNHADNRKIFLRILLVGFTVCVLMVLVGEIRSGSELSLEKLINRVVVQSTACDTTHVFNCAVDAWKNGKGFGGYTFLSYLVNCIPLLDDPYSFQSLIRDIGYSTAGGGLLFAEGYANFGYLFSLLSAIIFLVLFTLVIKRTTRYRFLIYVELCISIFRICWYGFNYPMTTLIYFVPLVWIADTNFRRKS